MTEGRLYTRYGEKKVGTSNKFYEVRVEENDTGSATVIYTWGRIGTLGQSKTLVAGTFDYGQSLADEQFEKKRKKGYREVTAMEALASAVEDVTERKRNGLSEVEIVIPRFHAGPSEARCRKFCEKYLDKLNVIRGSRWDMWIEDYTKQIENMLKSYAKEWTRITRSKTHGSNLDGAADTAAKMFFNELMENAGATVYVFFAPSGAQ